MQVAMSQIVVIDVGESGSEIGFGSGRPIIALIICAYG